MKLTKESLLQLIKEEMDRVQSEPNVISQEVINTHEDTIKDIPNTVTTPTTDSSELIPDVDTIITSLEQLSSELKEQLEKPIVSLQEWLSLDDNDKMVNEFQEADIAAMAAVGAGGALAMRQTYRWLVVAPGARKAQRKVNKMKLQLIGLKQASEQPQPDSLNAPDGATEPQREAARKAKDKFKDKQERLKSKFEAQNKNVDDMQQLVDDKYEKYGGDMVKRALTAEKMKGRKEVWETEAGLLKDNPKEAQRLKKQMASLDQRMADEEAALKELEPDKKEQEGAVAQANQEVEENPEVLDDEPAVEAPAAEEPEPEEEEVKAVNTTVKGEDSPEEIKRKAALAKKKMDKETKASKDKMDKEAKAAKNKIDNKEDDTKPTEEPEKNSKDDMLQRLETMLDKEESKEEPSSEKIEKIRDMISKVSTKESWQIDGTVLGNLFEREIKALENMESLNESRYQNLSIRDRFSSLL